jgi:hypothetical protein
MSTRRLLVPLTRVLIVITCTFLYAQQPPRPAGSLTLEEVVKLHQAGFSDELLITRIRKNAKSFDLTADELVELKKLGLGENVINFLLDPSLPYTPPAPPAAAPNHTDPPPVAASVPAAKPKDYPADPYASRIPAEPGIYGIRGDQPERIEIKVLLGMSESAGLGKVLMKKGRMAGYLPGLTSKTRYKTATPPPVFYVRLPQGKPIEEVVLLAMDPKQDRREIEMGPGPKPELKADAIRPFERLEVEAQLFRVAPGNLLKGEYMFLLLGSAEPPKGSFGKGYDFGIDASHPAKGAAR